MPVPSQGHYGFHSFPVDWFVCLYTYEFWLSLCKIARSSVILLLPLFDMYSDIKLGQITSVVSDICLIIVLVENG